MGRGKLGPCGLSGGLSAGVVGDAFVVAVVGWPGGLVQSTTYRLPFSPSAVRHVGCNPVPSLITDSGDVWMVFGGELRRCYNLTDEAQP